MGVFRLLLLLRLLRMHLFMSFPVLQHRKVEAAPKGGQELLITAPPNPQATHCPTLNLLKRQESCQYGQCGAVCLDQGAFCCGPAGTLATSPFWVCDNGACITSVRGTTGIVDCYDPDNPSGTTQSCVDLHATTSCHSTDRCYTCDPDEPFCRWETYIASDQPTFSWFSCVTTKLPDQTFYAEDITGNLPTNLHPQDTGATDATTSSTSTPDLGDHAKDDSGLSTGAIAGIAVGGGIAFLGAIVAIAWYCLKKRKARQPPSHELGGTGMRTELPNQRPHELDASRTMSELNSATAYSPYSGSEGYARNMDDIERWRQGAGVGVSATELQAKGFGFGPHDQLRELEGSLRGERRE